MSEIRNAISVNQLDVKRLLQSSLGKYSIYAYENKGYCAAISSINDYFEFNMDLMKKEVRDELFNPQRPIYTKVRDDAPSRYGLTSNVKIQSLHRVVLSTVRLRTALFQRAFMSAKAQSFLTVL